MLKMALIIVICWLLAVLGLSGVQADAVESWLTKLIDLGWTGGSKCGWKPRSLCQDICCPRFKSIRHHPPYDERQYDAMVFAYTIVSESSPEQAQAKGLTALCKYTGGSNEGGHQIPMTGPALTSIGYSEENLGVRDYTVALYLPPSYDPPPKPYDQHINFTSMPSRIIRVQSADVGSAADSHDAPNMDLGDMTLEDLTISGQWNSSNRGAYFRFMATYRTQCNVPHRVDEFWFIPATAANTEAIAPWGKATTNGFH